jgi:hypothetical protein
MSHFALAGEIAVHKFSIPGHTVSFLVPEQTLAKQHAWDALSSSADISPDQATRSAIKWLSANYPQISFEVETITLRHVDSASYNNLWIYDIRFIPTPKDARIPFASWYNVVVLFDGSVIGPTITEIP